MAIFVINATATRTSGALTILKQFIANIPQGCKDSFYFMVNPNVSLPTHSNIEYIAVDTESWLNRIVWDEHGFKKFLKNHDIQPDLIISFQNTCVAYDKSVPQLVYYHQLMAVDNHKWSVFKKDERLFYFYKHVYPFFIKRHIHKNTRWVVQTDVVKSAFINKINVDPSTVYVIRPAISLPDYSAIAYNKDFQNDKIHLIYPATPFSYKNHQLILKALLELKRRYTDVYVRLKVHFTLQRDDLIKLGVISDDMDLDDVIVYEGFMSSDKLLSCYKSAHALLFPSFIETLGLPLLEAAAASLPIYVADLPYARDVMKGYSGAHFLPHDDANLWAKAIASVAQEGKKHYVWQSSPQKEENGWDRFFELMKQMIK